MGGGCLQIRRDGAEPELDGAAGAPHSEVSKPPAAVVESLRFSLSAEGDDEHVAMPGPRRVERGYRRHPVKDAVVVGDG